VKAIFQRSISEKNSPQREAIKGLTTPAMQDSDAHSPGELADRKEVWKMFDRIAHRYDLLNQLLSFGQDVIWRRKESRHLKDIPDQVVLDLATGTADLLIAVCQKNSQVKSGVGIDLAEKMLDIGKRKIAEKNLDSQLKLELGDAVNIPFSDNSFDAVMIAFGIRNVEDIHTGLLEMNRVLKAGGRVLILEFSLPQNRIIRSVYLFYFRRILPRIGALISGDKYAYGYLNETVEAFPYGKDFEDLMSSAGFTKIKSTPLTFGIATIYQGDKE
jgi:demethylmenaquinone methyltransferase/2-methoxy-6-polyprenyl-1,4-benzoquinol methylase